jgi:hypothetical protein
MDFGQELKSVRAQGGRKEASGRRRELEEEAIRRREVEE